MHLGQMNALFPLKNGKTPPDRGVGTSGSSSGIRFSRYCSCAPRQCNLVRGGTRIGRPASSDARASLAGRRRLLRATHGKDRLRSRPVQPAGQYVFVLGGGNHAAVNVGEARGEDDGVALPGGGDEALVEELGAAAVLYVVQVGDEGEGAVGFGVGAVDVPGVEAFAGLVPLDLRRVPHPEASSVLEDFRVAQVVVDEAGELCQIRGLLEVVRPCERAGVFEREVGALLDALIERRTFPGNAVANQFGIDRLPEELEHRVAYGRVCELVFANEGFHPGFRIAGTIHCRASDTRRGAAAPSALVTIASSSRAWAPRAC